MNFVECQVYNRSHEKLNQIVAYKVLALISSFLGFDVIEVWAEDRDSGLLECCITYYDADHNEASISSIDGRIFMGKQHAESICSMARKSPDNYYWGVVKESRSKDSPCLDLNITTEMVYAMESDRSIFLVAFSRQIIDYKPYKIKFIAGLATAIFAAIKDATNEEDESIFELKSYSDIQRDPSAELDVKLFTPSRTISVSNSVDTPARTLTSSRIPTLDLSLIGLSSTLHSNGHVVNPPASNSPNIIPFYEDKPKIERPLSPGNSEEIKANDTPRIAHTSLRLGIPYWEPVSDFSFPIAHIPIKQDIALNLSFESFSEVHYIAEGSNSDIYTGIYRGDKVVIKMIKESSKEDLVATQEFDIEFGTLARISHPNIVKIYGAGYKPRRFIVLEWLGGGSLSTTLGKNAVTAGAGIAKKLFHKSTFTFVKLLQNALLISEVLDYLHRRCHAGATFIHRDLKPENIGYTTDGKLKLFDFGLVTCINARTSDDEAHEMTGCTGSLRYMAPEVVLKGAYNEKADIYSFAIILWQAARDRQPYTGLSKVEFMKSVVEKGERPKLDKTWPPQFTSLIQRCWSSDPIDRPPASLIVTELKDLLAKVICETGDAKRGRSIVGSNRSLLRTSSWF